MSDNLIPKYDFSFLKQFQNSFYNDFKELVNSYLANLTNPIYQISNALWEKGFKYFITREGKLNKFFDYDPNLTDMYLTPGECANFINSEFGFHFKLIRTIRNNSNNIKHDLKAPEPLTEEIKENNFVDLCRLFVGLNNRYFKTKAVMPSKEYIMYLCSAEDYKSDKRDEEIKSAVKDIAKPVKEKVKKINSNLKIKKSELELVNAQLKESEEMLKLLNDEIEFLKRHDPISGEETNQLNYDDVMIFDGFFKDNKLTYHMGLIEYILAKSDYNEVRKQEFCDWTNRGAELIAITPFCVLFCVSTSEEAEVFNSLEHQALFYTKPPYRGKVIYYITRSTKECAEKSIILYRLKDNGRRVYYANEIKEYFSKNDPLYKTIRLGDLNK